MNITVTAERTADDTLTATITIAAADVDKAITQTYKDIAKKYNFQGFRRGRAPRPVIDSIVGRDSVLAQATNDLLNAAEPLMREELNVVPLGDVSFGGGDPALAVQGADYEVQATMTVRPEAALDSYEPIAINMPPAEVTEAEVDWQLGQLMTYQVEYQDLEEQRPAVTGDFVSVDIENVEGAGHLAGTGRLVQIGAGQVVKQIEDALLGMSAGETKDVEWTQSHTHEDQTLSHDFKVRVTLQSVKKAVIPEVDDAIAKRFGYDDVAALREAVREEVAGDKAQQLPELKENRVVSEAAKRLTLQTIPEAYVSEIFNEVASEFLNQLQSQNISLDMYLSARGIKSDDFVADLRAQALERARESLALDAVAAELGLEATDDELEAEFQKAGMDPAEAVEQWRSEGRLPAIRESIKRTKALDYLVANAQVTEVDEVAERAAAQAAEAVEEAVAEVEAEEATETVEAEPEVEAEAEVEEVSETVEAEPAEEPEPAAEPEPAEEPVSAPEEPAAE